MYFSISSIMFEKASYILFVHYTQDITIRAVGCGVCDTPKLWCGAAGLCASVRACAGAAESLHTYIQ